MVARCQAAGGAGGMVCPVCAVCRATGCTRGGSILWSAHSWQSFYLFIYLLWFYLMLHVQEGHSTWWRLGICMDAVSGCLGGVSFTLDPSCAVLKGNSKTCRRCVLHPTASKHTPYFGLCACGKLYLSSLATSQWPQGWKKTPLPLHGSHVLMWCHMYISKVKFETWPHDIRDTFKVFS